MAFKTCETDVEWGGDAERGVNPDYRVIEIAGMSHISKRHGGTTATTDWCDNEAAR
jgi:hypothetical protein